MRKKEDLIVFSIKTLAMATAVSAGFVFAMPVASQAMPVTSPAQIKSVSDSNIVNVNHRKKSSNWWARHCRISNDVKCRRSYTRSYRRHYNQRYYGYSRPYRYNDPGITIRID
jgi:hypothetical protein